MLPLTHAIIGALTSMALFCIFPPIGWFGALVIFLASVFIDVDHYLYYIIKKKDLSLKNAYGWFVNRSNQLRKMSASKRRLYKNAILIFHGVEFLAVLAALSLISPIFKFVIIGCLIHYVLDFIDYMLAKEPLYSKVSQIYTYIKNKKKRELK